MSKWLSWLWWASSYVSEVVKTYENFYAYLLEPTHVQLVPGILRKGSWISRSMGRYYDGLGPIPYCQHHGAVVEVNRAGHHDEEVWVLHFQENKVKKSLLKDFMGPEKVCNVYVDINPNITEPDYTSWNGHYNLVTNNCEHLVSFLIDGIAHSKQVEVAEKIAWDALWTRELSVPESLKRPLAGRYLV